jgi:hypothetical protein
VAAALGAALAHPAPLAAQAAVDWMARAVPAWRRADPAPDRSPDTEFRLTQPMVGLRAALPLGLGLLGTINLESVTLADGELTPGAWGEGFVDRRHPHTTVHELMLVRRDLLGRLDGDLQFGIAVGKGFVPFGTDDPMSRPFLSYPVNHHFAQVLERAVVIGQAHVGPLLLEGSFFNGDEPERPGQWPLIRHDGKWRFGDSRSLRATVRVLEPLEVSGSVARVASPEHRPGAGGVHRKQSLAARWHDTPAGTERYLFAEWARNDELDGFFVFHSVLAEAALRRGRWGVAYRFERTERPEEHRLADPYRSQRPHLENSILGTLRWTLHTARLDADLAPLDGRIRVQPFAEVTLGGVAKVGGGIADPVGIYGTTAVRHLALGVVLEHGMRHHRMGRYGHAAAVHH